MLCDNMKLFPMVYYELYKQEQRRLNAKNINIEKQFCIYTFKIFVLSFPLSLNVVTCNNNNVSPA